MCFYGPPAPTVQDKCDGETGYGQPCSPIIINRENGPWRLSGSADPVLFDIDADGVLDRLTWTARDARLVGITATTPHLAPSRASAPPVPAGAGPTARLTE